MFFKNNEYLNEKLKLKYNWNKVIVNKSPNLSLAYNNKHFMIVPKNIDKDGNNLKTKLNNSHKRT